MVLCNSRTCRIAFILGVTLALSYSVLAQTELLRKDPPGDYANLAPEAYSVVESLPADRPWVATYYFYWYDVNTGHHMQLQERPTNLPLLSWYYVDWHQQELSLMAQVGIDVVLPVYWGSQQNARWSHDGLKVMVTALEQMEASGIRAPKVGMFFDTSALRQVTGGQNLITQEGKTIFYRMIRDFFSTIPPRFWIAIDGRPLVFLYNNRHVTLYDETLFPYVKEAFAADFGGLEPFIVAEAAWAVPADMKYKWGAALSGPKILDIAAVGPGYNDTIVPGRTPSIRDREGGAFYERSWQEVLSGPKPPGVVIETWNEFHEGTPITETIEYGTLYLDLTAHYTALLKSKPWVHLVAPDSSTPLHGDTPLILELDPQDFSVQELVITWAGEELHRGTDLPQSLTLPAGRLGDGLHELKVTLTGADGVEHLSTIRLFVSNARIVQPRPGHRVRDDEMVVEVDVRVPAEHIQKVEISIDGAPIYSDSQVPERLLVDTSQLVPGEFHRLSLTVVSYTDARSQDDLYFQTHSEWELFDAFDPPVELWFGPIDQSRTLEESGSWHYVTDNAETFFGDASRKGLITGGPASLTWRASNLMEYDLTIYISAASTLAASPDEAVRLAVRSDNGDWHQLAFAVHSSEQSEAQQWQRFTIYGTVPQTLTADLFRLEVIEEDADASLLQLGEVRLRGIGLLP